MTKQEFTALKNMLDHYQQIEGLVNRCEATIKLMRRDGDCEIKLNTFGNNEVATLNVKELPGLVNLLEQYLNDYIAKLENEAHKMSIIAPQPAGKDDEIPF